MFNLSNISSIKNKGDVKMIYAKKLSDFEIEYVNNCAVEELATVAEVEDYICLGAEIPGECLIGVKEGYIVADEQCDTHFFKKDSICRPMFSSILETFV